jgi:hypothetical protein
MELKEQILVALGLKKGEVNLGWQSKAEDGTIFVSTLDALEVSWRYFRFNRRWKYNSCACWRILYSRWWIYCS